MTGFKTISQVEPPTSHENAWSRLDVELGFINNFSLNKLDWLISYLSTPTFASESAFWST